MFAGDDSVPGRTNLVEHHIDLKENARPFKLLTRRFPMHLQNEANKEVQKMLDNGIVEQSNSEFSSPLVLVRKKDGTVRFCIDYRKLNDLTVKHSYPLPRISEAIDWIGADAKYFSSLTLLWVTTMSRSLKRTSTKRRFSLDSVSFSIRQCLSA